MLPRTNIENRLKKERQKLNPDTDSIIEAILAGVSTEDDKILKTLSDGQATESNTFNTDRLELENIYHIDTIKTICVNYRLRFLHSKFFKAKLPYEAIIKIKELEKEHNTTIEGFKVMAPSIMFKLENADDPVLFAPIGNGYFYLIHKWGNDLNPFRKILMWPFKSFDNLIVLIFLVSLLCTYLVPNGLFSKEQSTQEFIMLFFFMFKAVAGVVLFYGFSKGKNFNTAIWDSKYYNA